MNKRISVYGYDGYLDQDNKGRSFDDILAATTAQDVCGITFRSLKRNKSDALPKRLPSMGNLNYIDLTSCHLTEFPESLSQMETLTVLNIAKNDISSLLTDWKKLSGSLHELNLSDNPLVSLEESLNDLKCLEVLNLADCSLSSFPAVLTQLKQLKTLDISGNKIAILPLSVSSLQNLETLNASGCGLVGVPTVLSKLPNLTNLDLSDNPLNDLPRQLPQALPSVQTIRLCNCGFRFFPESLLRMKKLNNLDLSRNPISYIPTQLMKCSLYSLTMCGCELTEITTSTSSLHHLNIRDNKIKTISEEAAMDLRDKNVWFDSEYLQKPPREVLDLGQDAVQRYFKELELETALCSKIQNVIILGESGSGKTSLARTLTAGNTRLTSAEDRTVLCENHMFEYDRSLHFQITDLGGHNSFEMMYPVLMKDKSSIGVVTVDLSSFRRKKSEEQLTNWLQMCIQNLNQTSSVVVVGTKADICGNLSRKKRQITEVLAEWKYNETMCIEKMLAGTSTVLHDEQRKLLLKAKSQLAQFDISLCVTSAFENSGICFFADLLTEKTGQNGTVLPKAWIDIYRLFTEKPETFDTLYLPVGDVKAMIKRELKARLKRQRLSPCSAPNGHANTNVDLCLRYFHNRGVILWFENHQRLKNIIIFRPSSIFETMKLLFQSDLASSLLTKNLVTPFKDLTSQYEAANKLTNCGIASETLFQCIFHGSRRNKMNPPIILEILKMLGFCYEIPTIYPKPSSSYYFPWFVTNNLDSPNNQCNIPPWEEAITSESLQLQCHFEFFQRVPLSMFEQLLVKVYCNLYPGQTIETSADSVRCVQNGVDIFMEKKRSCDENTKVEGLVVKMRAGKEDLPELFRIFIETVCDLQTILEHCPCIIRDQYMVCPHCLLTRGKSPTHLPIDNVTFSGREHLRLAMKSVQCHGTSVPASLYFPQLLATGENEHQVRQVADYCEKIARENEQGRLNDELLLKLSKFITSESKLYDVGLHIGLRHHHIEEVRTDHSNTITLAAFHMLLTWRRIFLKCSEDEEQMIQKLHRATEIAGISNTVLKEIPEINNEWT